MDIYPSTSEYAHWPVEADVDLSAATFEVYIEGAWRSCAWVAAATQSGDTWARTARLLLSGSVDNPGVVVTASVRRPPYRVAAGGEVIVRNSKYSLNVRS